MDYSDKVVVKGIQRVFMDGQKVVIEEPKEETQTEAALQEQNKQSQQAK